MAKSYTYITAATTTQVKSGRGIFHSIIWNKPVNTGTVSVYDAVSTDTTPVIAIVTTTANVKPFFIAYDHRFTIGLKIVTTQAQDLTVVWQ